MADQDQDKPAHKIVADFMTGTAPLEAYLQQGRPLTPIQTELIGTTISELETFFRIWKRKHNLPDDLQSPFISSPPSKQDKS